MSHLSPGWELRGFIGIPCPGGRAYPALGTGFFSRLRKSIRAPGLDLEPLPGGERQRRHCPNKSSLLCRCLGINPAVCCAWQQKSRGTFSSKEQTQQTLQGWHCQRQRVIGGFSSLLAGDGFPSPGSATVEVFALLKGGGCFSTPPRGGFGWGTLLSKTPHPPWDCSVLLSWVTPEGHQEQPLNVCPLLCPCSGLGRGSPSHQNPSPAVPVPTTFSSPHLANPWVTCSLNEPLPRLLWLLTFLNDES